MPVPSDVVKGKLVLTGLPDLFCYKDVREMIASLPQLLGVEVSASVTNVIVSNVQPTSSNTTSLWVRISNSGGFMGFYVFSAGAWQSIYPIFDEVHAQIQWFSSFDGSVPAGWTKITVTTTEIPASLVPALMAQYVLDPTSSFDIYFAAFFSGF